MSISIPEGRKNQLIILAVIMVLFGFLTFSTAPWSWTFSRLFPDLKKVLYDMAGFPELVGEHIALVAISSVLATLIGLTAGIFATRPWGRDFLPAVNALSSIGHTFPPVAVLAMAVPVVGFGFKPTIIALFIYGLLPVVRNTIAGIQSLDSGVLEAARGMGMTPVQVLTGVELPLASPVIMAGVRLSTVINIGTATLGATIGAGGLGKPIIAGLIGENPSFILEGAILVGMFAVIVDTVLGLFPWNTGT